MADAIPSGGKRATSVKRGEGGKFIVPPKSPGRPKGSRNKLGEAFLKDMLADWEVHGVDAIATVREEKPDAYLKVVASILPKEIDLGDNAVSALKESRDASTAAFYRAMAEDAEQGLPN